MCFFSVALRFTGLQSHPQHELAKRQAKGFSGMVTFFIRGGIEQSESFFKAAKVKGERTPKENAYLFKLVLLALLHLKWDVYLQDLCLHKPKENVCLSKLALVALLHVEWHVCLQELCLAQSIPSFLVWGFLVELCSPLSSLCRCFLFGCRLDFLLSHSALSAAMFVSGFAIDVDETWPLYCPASCVLACIQGFACCSVTQSLLLVCAM